MQVHHFKMKQVGKMTTPTERFSFRSEKKEAVSVRCFIYYLSLANYVNIKITVYKSTKHEYIIAPNSCEITLIYEQIVTFLSTPLLEIAFPKKFLKNVSHRNFWLTERCISWKAILLCNRQLIMI